MSDAAVVLMAYGSPERLADVPAYYADIRGGRPIRPELLADLVERYRRLGIEDVNPLNAIAEKTRSALETELGLPVFTGMKHWTPRIADAAEAALETGATTVAGLVLAPHYSRLSVGGYRRQLEDALASRAELVFVESWHDEPGFVELLSRRVGKLTRRDRRMHVVFTAHSLPARILEEGDPYQDQLLETSRAIAQRVALRDWSFSYQSESQTGEPWLQPDILDHLADLHGRGVDDVLVCPIGFVADHLEIRWDLDTEAMERAEELGMRLARIEMPNADPAFVRVLAGIVRRRLPAAPRDASLLTGGEKAVKLGEIRVERAARRFRVYPQPVRTLKEWAVARRRAGGTDVWALQDVSMAIEPGEAVGLIGRNGSGKTTLLRLVAGIIKPTSGRVEAGGRVASLLELGAGFHPEFTGRENVFLNGSIHGLGRTQIRAHMDEIVAFSELERFIDLPVRTYSSGMYMRLGFAVAAHIEADVLLLDEVFAVGDEEFQRKCFGKIFEFKQRGGTIVFVSHDASSVERLCERAVLLVNGRVELDGSVQEAIARYHKLLADERDPDERAAGLREYGSGEVRIAEARLLGPDGEERLQFLAGEPMTVRLRVVSEEALPPPRISLELRDEAGLLLSATGQDTAELGWQEAPGERVLRFELDRPPLADGRFRLRLELTDAAGRHLYHWLDDAARFVVYPGEAARGPVLLEGRWSLEGVGAAAEIGGT